MSFKFNNYYYTSFQKQYKLDTPIFYDTFTVFNYQQANDYPKLLNLLTATWRKERGSFWLNNKNISLLSKKERPIAVINDYGRWVKLIPIKFILLQHQLFNPQFIYQIVKDHYKKNSEFKYLKQTQENKLYCQLLKNINNQLKKNIDVLRRWMQQWTNSFLEIKKVINADKMKELVSKQDEELNNYVFKYLEVIDKIYLAECHLMFLQRVWDHLINLKDEHLINNVQNIPKKYKGYFRFKELKWILWNHLKIFSSEINYTRYQIKTIKSYQKNYMQKLKSHLNKEDIVFANLFFFKEAAVHIRRINIGSIKTEVTKKITQEFDNFIISIITDEIINFKWQAKRLIINFHKNILNQQITYSAIRKVNAKLNYARIKPVNLLRIASQEINHLMKDLKISLNWKKRNKNISFFDSMKAELINKYLKNPEIIIFQNINNHLKQRQLKQLFIICRQMKLQKPNLQFVFVTNKAQNLKQGCQTSYSCERNKLSQLIVPINNLQKKNYLPIYYPHLLMHNIFLLQYNKKKATLSWSSYFKNFPLLLKTQQKIIQTFYRPDKLQIIAERQAAFNTICLKITKINTLFCFNKHIMQVFLNKNLFLYVYNETNVTYEKQKNWWLKITIDSFLFYNDKDERIPYEN